MTDLTEAWRPIPWAPRYEVSDAGRVRSYARSTLPRMLATTPDAKGYLRAGITGDTGRAKNQHVHVLVAELFIGPRPAGAEVRHYDGNPENNAAANLRYGTAAENAADRRRHGTQHRGERTGGSRLRESEVAEIKTLAKAGGRTGELARRFGVGLATITDIKKGRTWHWLEV